MLGYEIADDDARGDPKREGSKDNGRRDDEVARVEWGRGMEYATVICRVVKPIARRMLISVV